MDIKEIDLRCSDFEAMHPVAKLFNFDHEKLTYFGDAYDDAKRLNDLWSTWCACVGLLYLETNTAKAQAVPEWISVKDQLPPSDPYNREYWVYETLNNKVQHDYWVCPDTGLDQDFEPFFNNWPREVTHWMPMVKYPKPPVQAKEPTND